jgi:hypothetical protein
MGWFVTVGAVALLGSPSAATSAATSAAKPKAQGDVHTAEGHAHEDHVIHDAATERRLEASTEAQTAAAAAAAAVPGSPADIGAWGPVVDWPVVGISAALLPNGKVLAFDSVGEGTQLDQSFTRATVWDPATGTQTPVNTTTGYNIFCSGIAHLPDGSPFMAGGNGYVLFGGIVQTHVFHPATNTWSLGPNMKVARWYPTVTPLRDGEMLITSGGPNTPEVFTGSGPTRELLGASKTLPLYPWLDVAPDGRAAYTGPDDVLRRLDATGLGAWVTYGPRDGANRDYGGHVLYDIGKVLVAGGGPSLASAVVVDINGNDPTITPTGSMAIGRRQHNVTVLADGTVLATGGNSSGASLVDLANGVYAAELWNPATGTWRTLAAMQVTRQYHSTALLLPDGRVLSAGGGICGTCDDVGYLAKNAEIYSPPYLFAPDGSGALATRPAITSAPETVGYGAAFQVTSPDAASISKVALVRLGAVTHSNNMDQRYVPLSFTAGAGSLTATAPANANIAPPGVYMLFVVNSAGVPSVAAMVGVGVPVRTNLPPSVQITAPLDGASSSLASDITVSIDATDDHAVSRVEFYVDGIKVAEDATAPYSFTGRAPWAGTFTLTARAVDDDLLGSVSTPVTITVGP